MRNLKLPLTFTPSLDLLYSNKSKSCQVIQATHVIDEEGLQASGGMKFGTKKQCSNQTVCTVDLLMVISMIQCPCINCSIR